MAYSYDDMQGSPSDPQDHEATNVPQANAHYAGDVVSMPSSSSPNTGKTPEAAGYAVGTKSDDKVLSIGRNTLVDWHNRNIQRGSK